MDSERATETDEAYTRGRVEQLGTNLYVPGELGANVCSVGEPRTTSVGYTPTSLRSGDFHEAHANARRLAALWNACEGIATADLESVAREPDAVQRFRMLSHHAMVRANEAQRRQPREAEQPVECGREI